MLASKYVLAGCNSVIVEFAPDEVRQRPDGVLNQAAPAAILLIALNLRLCGETVGRFERMLVFNRDDDDV